MRSTVRFLTVDHKLNLCRRGRLWYTGGETGGGDVRKRTYEATYATKRAICAALKELMAERPLNKITIGEIMARCGMARQHFYYHFEDLYDAVFWMFEEEAVSLLRRHEGALLWQDGLLQLFQYLQENRAVCLCALNSMGREHLKHFFQKDISAVIRNTIQTVAEERGWDRDGVDAELLTQFYVGALAGITERWLLGEIPKTPQELIRFADIMLTDQVRGASLRLGGQGAPEGARREDG